MKNKLLLVDDDTQLLEELAALFEENKVGVLTASCGADSLRIAEQEGYDSALVDIKLPDCNGLELVTQLKQRQPNSSYIMMTAHATLDSTINAIEAGVQGYILKPFSPKTLLEVVRRGFAWHDSFDHNRQTVENMRRENEQLTEKVNVLRKLNQLYSDRENQLREIQDEVNQLLLRLGQPTKY